MLSRIFPKQFDNDYRGYQFAVWLLALFLLAKTFASVNQIGFNPLWTSRDVLQSIEGVPGGGTYGIPGTRHELAA